MLLLNAWNSKDHLFRLGPSRDEHGSIVIDEEPAENEARRLSILRFLGVFMAKLVVMEGVAPEIDLSHLLYRVHTGCTTFASPPSPREEAFVGGFNEVAPQRLLASVPLDLWATIVDFSRNTSLRWSRWGTLSNYHTFIKMCELQPYPVSGLSEDLRSSISEADSDHARWPSPQRELLIRISKIVADPAADNMKSELRALVEEAFEGGDFFVKSDQGALTLHSAPVASERAHCLALELVGALTGLCISSSLPVGYAMDARIYEGLGSGRAELEPDKDDDPITRERFRSFFLGLHAVIPCLAFTTLTREDIALLFEWGTQSVQSLIRLVFCIPSDHQSSTMAMETYDRFSRVLSSMSLVIVRKVIQRFHSTMQISLEGFSSPSSNAIKLVFVGNLTRPVTFSTKHPTIFLDPSGSDRDVRAHIYAYYLKHQPSLSSDLVLETLKGADWANRVAVLRTLIEMSKGALELTLPREDIFQGSLDYFLESREKGKNFTIRWQRIIADL